MIYQYHSLDREISECLNVDKCTVSRTVALFNESRTFSNVSILNLTRRTLSDAELCIDKPGIYLSELQQALLDEHGTDVSTICKCLQEADITRQKMVITAKQSY